MLYSRLISSMKWKFDYVSFAKKRMGNNSLEKLCNEIVDVI